MLDRHLTDEELLLAADGELPAAGKHLLACDACRRRMETMEIALAEFSQAHHATLNAQLPPADAARRSLAMRLEASTQPVVEKRAHFSLVRLFTIAAILFVTVMVTKSAWLGLSLKNIPIAKAHFAQSGPADRNSSLPDRSLTPGKFQNVRLQDVCRATPYEQDRVTSVSLKQRVLAEYGMPANADADHEIDYLVIPELGGTDDIQNLWPEPYSSTEWNARVKDALEEHLHDLVCEQKLDLATAQHDIATDWISAYKKYFHTDRPIYVGHST